MHVLRTREALAIIEADQMALDDDEDPWTHGHCAQLAHAVAEYVGGAVKVFVMRPIGGARSGYSWGHAFVSLSTGQFIDGRGLYRDESDLRRVWRAGPEVVVEPYSARRDNQSLYCNVAMQKKLVRLLRDRLGKYVLS